MREVTLLIARDFPQTLPVILEGSKADENQRILQNLRRHVKKLHLRNMTVFLQGNHTADEFEDELLKIANGILIFNSRLPPT